MPIPRNPRLRYYLKRAARIGNLFLGRIAEGMRVYRQLGGQFPIAKHLDGIRRPANEAVRAQQFRGYRLSCRKYVQFLQVDHRILHPEMIVKAALRNAAMPLPLSD